MNFAHCRLAGKIAPKRRVASAVGTATGRSRGPVPVLEEVENFLSSISSTPALGPIQPPIRLAAGVISPRVKRRGVKWTAHLRPVVKSKDNTSRYIHSPMSPHGVMLNQGHGIAFTTDFFNGSILILFGYMFRSFDHLQVGLHDTERTDPPLLGHLSY
jgi:hypothetical protein